MPTPAFPFTYENNAFISERPATDSLMHDKETIDHPFVHLGNGSKLPVVNTGFKSSSSDYLEEDTHMQL